MKTTLLRSKHKWALIYIRAYEKVQRMLDDNVKFIQIQDQKPLYESYLFRTKQSVLIETGKLCKLQAFIEKRYNQIFFRSFTTELIEKYIGLFEEVYPFAEPDNFEDYKEVVLHAEAHNVKYRVNPEIEMHFDHILSKQD